MVMKSILLSLIIANGVSANTPVSLNHLGGPDIPFDYSLPQPAGSKKCALINVAMDESGSMQNGQTFMRTRALPSIISTLYSASYGYDHVFVCSNGFGYWDGWMDHWDPNNPEELDDWHDYRFLGCSKGTTSGKLVNSTVIDAWVTSGGWEEGYYAMTQAMDNVNRYIDGVDLNEDCSELHRNMILVTDEDRDSDPYKPSIKDVDSMRADLEGRGYITNVVVDARIDGTDNNVGMRISNGKDAEIFTADGAGGYTISNRLNVDWTTYVTNVWLSYADGVNEHYIPLVTDSPGAVWNVNVLRDMFNNAVLVDSFTKAFVEIKVQEIAATTPASTSAPTSGPTSAPTSAPTKAPIDFPDIGNTETSDLNTESNNNSAGSNGDPHFKTWHNEHFEFHGQCDLILAKDANFANGIGLNVQIRTKLVRFWSYIKSAAILIGDDVLEVQGTNDIEPELSSYWINFQYGAEPKSIGGFPLTIYDDKVPVHPKRRFEIDLNSKYPGQKIIISTFKEFVKVDFVNPSTESFGNAVGMLGDFKSGETLSRDQATVIHDFNEYGVEWQVLPADDVLFHDLSHPQFPEPCVLPEDPRGQRRRHLGEQSISLEQAEATCANSLSDPLDIKDCVYDIMATQDLEMVGAF
jgi:hypothetical protein